MLIIFYRKTLILNEKTYQVILDFQWITKNIPYTEFFCDNRKQQQQKRIRKIIKDL